MAGSDSVMMDLWCSGESTASIDIPTAPRRKWPELIPWTLEDNLLQGVEMHFIETTAEGQLGLCRQSSRLKRVAIGGAVTRHQQSMLPDYLALPWEPDVCVGWRDGVYLCVYAWPELCG